MAEKFNRGTLNIIVSIYNTTRYNNSRNSDLLGIYYTIPNIGANVSCTKNKNI